MENYDVKDYRKKSDSSLACDLFKFSLLERNDVTGGKYDFFKFKWHSEYSDYYRKITDFVEVLKKESGEPTFCGYIDTSDWWVKNDIPSKGDLYFITDRLVWKNYMPNNDYEKMLTIGTKVAVKYSDIRPYLSWSEKESEFGTFEVCFGEYPQAFSYNDKWCHEADDLYYKGELKKTNKKYTIRDVNNDSENLKIKTYDEYIYDDEKFIRYENSDGSIYLVLVRPIKWLVDTQYDIAVSKNVLFTGIPYIHPSYNNCASSYLEDYLSTNFARECITKKALILKLNIKKEDGDKLDNKLKYLFDYRFLPDDMSDTDKKNAIKILKYLFLTEDHSSIGNMISSLKYEFPDVDENKLIELISYYLEIQSIMIKDRVKKEEIEAKEREKAEKKGRFFGR